MAKKKLIEKKVVILQRYSPHRGFTYKEYPADLFEKNKDAILKDGYSVFAEKKEAQTEEVIKENLSILEPLNNENNELTL
mgnify:FL=1